MRLKEIEPGMVIRCETREEADALCDIVNASERWKEYWDKYTDDTCYEIGKGIMWSFGSVSSFRERSITKFSDLILPELSAEEKAYNKGLNDAWELARKIILSEYDGGMSVKDFYNIFDKNLADEDVLKKFTAQEALAKLEAYKKEQEEIKVGDVVYADDDPDSFGVVTCINKKLVYVMWNDGSCGSDTRLEELHKTGRYIDIESLLKQVGE